MSEDRPLDALIPALRAARGTGGLHLLEASIAGAPAWVLGLDRDPGGAAGLQRWAAQHIETAILARMAAPGPHVLGEDPTGYGEAPTGGLHLFLYADVAGNLARALQPFGLVPSELSGPRWDEVRTALAEGVGSTAPRATFTARVRQRPELPALHRALIEDTLEPWGAAPGRPASRLLHLVDDLTGTSVEPDAEGLDLVESLLVDPTTDVIRWMPPLLLQALADLVGVVAQEALRVPVQWAECAPEPDGYTPPPLLRLETRRETEPVHLPIAEHLVRWCVMPLQKGEQPVPLSAWLADLVG